MNARITLILALVILPASADVCSKSEQVASVSVQNVTISGATLLSEDDTAQIEKEIRDKRWQTKKEALEGACQAVWRYYGDRGYVQAKVEGDPAESEREGTALRIGVRVLGEGKQFRLKTIRWQNTRTFPESTLRKLIPMNDGEVFRVSSLWVGSEEIRRMYSSNGYVNVSVVPQQDIDNQTSTVALLMDIDEGEQFTMGRVEIVGLNEDSQQQFLNKWPLRAGDLYRAPAVDEFLHSFEVSEPNRVCHSFQEDLKNHTVNWTITISPAGQPPTS